MKKITVWEVQDKKTGMFHFNHIEIGWVGGDKPLPKRPEFTNQLAWSNYEWRKRPAYLTRNHYVI